MSLFQIILALIAIFFLINGIFKFVKRKKGQTIFKLVITIAIWGIILVFSIYPEATRFLTKQLGLGENLNTLIFLGFVVVFIILFKMINIIERIERDISEIVRKEALKKINKK